MNVEEKFESDELLIIEIYENARRAFRRLGIEEEFERAMHFGPAHIVWDDGNYDCALWCVKRFDQHSEGLSVCARAIVMWSLVELVAVTPQRKSECDDKTITFDDPCADGRVEFGAAGVTPKRTNE